MAIEEKARKPLRAHLTLQQKAMLREFLRAHPKMPQAQIDDWVQARFHVTIGRSTLYRIQHAKESDLAVVTSANLARKKNRRVKFPDFERDVLRFFHERRQQERELPDEMLMNQAKAFREQHRIDETQLKLSHGWLYGFKVRHGLIHMSRHAAAAAAAQTSKRTANDCSADVEAWTSPRLGEERVEAAGDHSSSSSRGSTPSSFLSAKALSTVKSLGVFQWEQTNAQNEQNQFVVVTDGVLVCEDGEYQINVEVKHTDAQAKEYACVFRVRTGETLVGECRAPVGCKNKIGWSVLELRAQLASNSVVRVEFQAPGYALHDSRLVIRRL